jgi:hydroxymethylpyrimidine pyrophosphatase-like HAD family hydrolase
VPPTSRDRDRSPAYRYAAFDLDGTLLDDDSTISDDTLNGLRRLKDSQLELFIVSGRSPHAFRSLRLPDSVLSLFEPVMVLSDGDIRWNWRTDSIEELRGVPTTVVPTLLSHGIKDFVVDTGRGLVASSRSAAVGHAIYYQYPRSSITIKDHPAAAPATKVVVYAEPDAVTAALAGVDGCGLHPAPEGKRCNVVPADSCKSAGLARLLNLRYHEPTLARVVAFGDGDNDACLLRTAGAGVAMVVSMAGAVRGATIRLNSSLATYLNQEFPRGLGTAPRAGLPCGHQP